MVVDLLVIYGLYILEKRLKEQKSARMETERLHNEVDKQENRAIKAANIQQRKTEQKKQHTDQKNSHNSHPVRRNPIMQPDKNTKLR